MAQNTTIVTTPDTWTLLTDSDVTSLSFQVVQAPSKVFFKGTVGANPPSTLAGSFVYKAEEAGEYAISLADMFPGLAATRLYAWSHDAADITVSHA